LNKIARSYIVKYITATYIPLPEDKAECYEKRKMQKLRKGESVTTSTEKNILDDIYIYIIYIYIYK